MALRKKQSAALLIEEPGPYCFAQESFGREAIIVWTMMDVRIPFVSLRSSPDTPRDDVGRLL